jgi:autotransporter-associated beta strand protein
MALLKMKYLVTGFTAFGLLLLTAGAASDPQGVLIKPIPDKLVVLTFDDGPASLYTVVAPILKEHGFNGSFYICDFDSFKTRKDWYMTSRQIKAMAAAGFEIGNHTVGHGGGLGNYLALEDQLLAHDIPKPTTLAWPVCAVFWDACPALATNGYIFGRGGHNRPYRPTVDNPFDVPAFGSSIYSVEAFVKSVRQATDGKISVLLYHGVPDMEHPPCTVEPAVFKAQMQYLKDNHYKVIALRDLAKYIDPAKALKLPPTARDYKEPRPDVLASEEVPAGRVELPAKPVAKNDVPEKTAKTMAVEAGAPQIPEPNIPKDGAPIALECEQAITVPKNGQTEIKNVIAGSGKLVKKGAGQLRLFNGDSTYSGGTVLASGSLVLFAQNGGIGSGPLTLNPGTSLNLQRVSGTNPLILNGGNITAGNGFGAGWDADIVVNDAPQFLVSTLWLNKTSGVISGPGGLIMAGTPGNFGPLCGGTLILCGTNTYTGPTTVRLGTLLVKQAAGLYHAAPSRWTPENITVCNTATLQLQVGGPGEFKEEQINILLANLTRSVNNNGLAGGSALALDTANAAGTVTLDVNIADSKGPGGGPLTLKKIGNGNLRLAGENTWSGPIVIEGGTLTVSSLNRVKGGKPASSLGAPTTLENGIISLGGDSTLVYTGTGEETDRIIDLTGNRQTVTFDQSGSGPLKFTCAFDISGFGNAKIIVLKGSSVGTGELGGDLANPYDRKKTATLALTKTGTGTWTLSGVNTYTGATTVNQGTLGIAHVSSLPTKAEVSIAAGATLELNFKGHVTIQKLTLAGKLQPPGVYSAASASGFITGTGVLKVSSLQ